NNWIPGYTVAIILFIEMMFYCLIGTQISVGDEKLCRIIYQCEWYNYDLVSQRTIILLLHYCQEPKHLRLGILGPLDVVTGITNNWIPGYTVAIIIFIEMMFYCLIGTQISILKRIYTYYTVMTELL
ncbi:hypothetical protein Bhyg_15824, partial [Pseudolycoriella hygida]